MLIPITIKQFHLYVIIYWTNNMESTHKNDLQV